jgi:hypothetical protein
MEKFIYALTFCYEGIVGSTAPRASTLAISDDREKLIQRMEEFIKQDCAKPDCVEDGWEDSCNYTIHKRKDNEVTLQHNNNTDLFITYKIEQVEVL